MFKKGISALAICAAILHSAILLMGQQGGQQDQPPPPPQTQDGAGPMAGGERAGGTIVSVGVDRFVVKKMSGDAQTVVVDNQTRLREGQRGNQKDLGLEDLKPGDHVMVMGKLDDHQDLVASFVRRITPEEIARFQNSGDRAFGQIVSIEGNELKIHNPYRGDQTVVVSDQTSMMKDGQAITLKDLKVGDRIMAMGKEADGKLTADRVMTGRFREGRGRMMRQRPDGQAPPQNP